MYESIKSILKAILPGSLITRNEAFLRSLVSARYKGDKYQCNICKFNLMDWIHLDRGDLLCPNCGSLGRTRRLRNVIERLDLENKKLLHFSPPKSLRTYFESVTSLDYVTTDFESEFEADQQYDITNIAVEDNTFDIIICYHVLEHITEDHKAIFELYRVIKDGGVLIVQTPFHDLPTAEDSSINTAELRLEHYGQEDHVRIYNAEDLAERISIVGFQVEILTYNMEIDNKNGFKLKEVCFCCTK